MLLSDVPDLSASDGHSIVDEPERDALLRLTKVVEKLFRVPTAYLGLLGPDMRVASRIGSGASYWDNMRTLPLQAALAEPQLWQDPGKAPEGFMPGGLRFVASAPLRSSDGLELGALAIADTRRRPDFTVHDLETLSQLAEIFAGKMELRTMAHAARETEFSLVEAERRFRHIANSAPVLIIYSGVDGECSFVNKTWLSFTGRTLEEELESYDATFHPDHRDAVVSAYWDAFQQRKPLTLEFPMRRHDGEYRWMLTHGVPRFQDDGMFCGYIGCFTDVTDQRGAIAELRKQVLCTAAVAEASGAFYLILDREGRIEQMSPRCQRTSQRDPAVMQGRFVWESCDAAIGTNAILIREAFQRARSTDLVATVRTPNQHWTFTPVRSEEGRTIAITATVFDQSRGSECSPCCPGTECECSR